MTKLRLITHNGSFHADDIFACATLSIFLENKGKHFEIIRTRDTEVIDSGDYVFDVGGIYDPEKNRFDHHQRGGADARENGIPYASFGLVWKHFGLELCAGNEEAWNIIDKKIASPIDAVDNGTDIVTPKFDGIFPYGGEGIFLIYSPTWKERELNIDHIFVEQVEAAKKVLEREIKVVKDDVEGKNIMIEAYNKMEDKRIVELDISFPRYLLQGTLCRLEECLYVVYPSAHGKNWKVEAVSQNPNTFESRKLFPESWRGILNSDPKAIEIIGIEGVNFSHKSGFMIVTASRESALAVAKKALEA